MTTSPSVHSASSAGDDDVGFRTFNGPKQIFLLYGRKADNMHLRKKGYALGLKFLAAGKKVSRRSVVIVMSGQGSCLVAVLHKVVGVPKTVEMEE